MLVGPSLGKGGAERVMADMSKFLSSTGYKSNYLTAYDDVDYNYSGNHISLGLVKGSPFFPFQTISAFFRWSILIKNLS